MEKNKTKKPYEKPSMTVYEVEPMRILAGSGDGPAISSSSYSDEWGKGGYDDTVGLEDIK